MMNVSRMLLVAELVDAGEMPEVAREAVAIWGGDPDSLEHIRSSSNHIFRFTQLTAERILRLQHCEEGQRSAIAGELDFIAHVVDQGLPAAHPIASTEGDMIVKLQSGGYRYYATVFEAAQGDQKALEELTPAMFEIWGRTLGLLHLAATTFSPISESMRPSWEDEIRGTKRWIPGEESNMHRERDFAVKWHLERSVDSDNYGLIHRDLEVDNMIWNGTCFHVFDFDDLMYHWFAADFASSVEDIWGSSSPGVMSISTGSLRAISRL